ncbi:PREDICTED: uncharacterized protein LOC104604237 [Nelumbo nucifera]|uniref:Uncharacterized protein LOC104604237 n=1 Tax=Nelumbo nucifera TaxID=4432 RepID=A0A1U8ALB4_NELNU|nr:PREDICTED: uncharacterized protein LOC104604237 [Nelumbo nucifera]XP_010266809.1 PREDICTED: uncharacterized protein LOC104604237 [Nelumbo nucifera]XP_010266810.1 PREDICTED: uncharacterized protein LOC104604237 [Nelumbo nucifera]
MTLEDFFTLTEIKDGLTAPARVEELVFVIKEKDPPVKNVGEAARQWSTVASTLAATENQGCLDRFVHLDGLCFLNQWLCEVQKFSKEKNDSFIEESITALLGALEKLPIDKERSVSSGIGVTVRNLFGHQSFKVQDRARALIDSWNQSKHGEPINKDAEKSETCLDGISPNGKITAESDCVEKVAAGVPSFRGNADEDNHVVGLAAGESQHSRSSDSSQLQSLSDTNFPMSNNQDTSSTTLSKTEEDGLPENALSSSVMSNNPQENPSVMENSSLHHTDGTGACLSLGPADDNIQKSTDDPEFKDFTDGDKETDTPVDCDKDIPSVYASLGPQCVSSTDDPDAQQSVVEPTKEMEFCLKKNSSLGLDSDIVMAVSDPKKGLVECGVSKQSRSTVEIKSRGQDNECFSNVQQDLSGNGCIPGKMEGSHISFCGKEDIGPVKDVMEHSSKPSLVVGKGEELGLPADVSQWTMDTEGSDRIDKRSEMDLEYGVDDALEVARQVAKEVEREVVDYREPLCSSSSEKNSAGGVVQPRSPDSINGEQDQQTLGPENEVQTGQNLSAVASSPNGEHLINPDNRDEKSEDCMQDVETSQVTEAAQEPEDATEKGICGFDLNEICSEETDRPMTPISAPIPVVAVSKAANTAGILMTPLHFGGELGWKGSAATSAFRRASPRRTPDGEKTPSVEGSSYSSKQRQDTLNIDLNIAGVEDEGVTGLVLTKHIPVSSGLPSGESSIEVSSKRQERLKLDLNRVGENEDVPSSDWRMEGNFLHHHRNGNRSPSPSSASSSRQPSLRNIDLNDSPCVHDDSHDRPSEVKLSSRDLNDPVISIMGARVEVNKKEILPQTRLLLPNGQVAESVTGSHMASLGSGIVARPVMTFTPTPMFGYNGLTMGPPPVSLPPAIYVPGSVPYMVDSRGAPVVPHVVGSPAPVSSSRLPFIMSMTGPPSGLNGVGSSRPGFDLNSGLTLAEGENREMGGFPPLFIQGQGRSSEEQIRSVSQSSSSGMVMKRKEPDSGWDPYSGSYKKQPPWN